MIARFLGLGEWQKASGAIDLAFCRENSGSQTDWGQSYYSETRLAAIGDVFTTPKLD